MLCAVPLPPQVHRAMRIIPDDLPPPRHTSLSTRGALLFSGAEKQEGLARLVFLNAVYHRPVHIKQNRPSGAGHRQLNASGFV